MKNEKTQKEKDRPTIKNAPGLGETIGRSALSDLDLTRDQVKQFLKENIREAIMVLSEIHTTQALEALTDTFYSRYEMARKQREAQPELNLNGKEA